MTIRGFLIISHVVTALLAAGLVAATALAAPSPWLVAGATLLALLPAFLVAWFCAAKFHLCYRHLVEIVELPERAALRPAGITEWDALAERLIETQVQWADATSAARVQGRELQALVSQFDRRADSGRVSEAGAAGRLRIILASLSQTAEGDLKRLLACTEEIEKTTRAISAGANEQADAVGRTTTYVEQLSVNIDSVAQNAGAANEAAAAAQASATEALQLVRELIEGMERIQRHVNAGERKIRALGERSQEIGSIVETIGTIAARTDLLALNASIESIRAGEHGRGFVIVAEEVRKLAEQAAQASREVAGLVEAIQTETQESIAVMADEHQQVEAEVRRVNAAGQALDRISRTSTDSARRVGEISQATRQQLRYTQEVVLAMERISEVAQETRGSAEGVCFNTRTLSNLVQQLDGSLTPLRGGPRSDRPPRAVDARSATPRDARNGLAVAAESEL